MTVLRLGTEPVDDGNPLPVYTTNDVSIGYHEFESLSVGATSVGFTADKLDGMRYAHVTSEGAVRYRLDGVAPTTSVGHLLSVNDVLDLDSREQLIGARFISTSGTVTVSVSYGS